VDHVSRHDSLRSIVDVAALTLAWHPHKTVKRVVEKFEAAVTPPPPRAERVRNYDAVTELVAERVQKSLGRISAKRLLPIARVTGYEGRRGTSDIWSRRRKCCGAGIITGTAAQRCGLRVRVW